MLCKVSVGLSLLLYKKKNENKGSIVYDPFQSHTVIVGVTCCRVTMTICKAQSTKYILSPF